MEDVLRTLITLSTSLSCKADQPHIHSNVRTPNINNPISSVEQGQSVQNSFRGVKANKTKIGGEQNSLAKHERGI
ncbi:hypothetical protein Y032_0037g3490 [Ancylostoma ceylanicum]|uniref:Uncharacterized protein n=1 Tax=Ancylostoma ceylanicum TaxID=53326 RepID=A0A016UJ27_9BILA|nr:hypothetical protein Y032_0037g3490 [Ancylostoma ceylanicum]